MTPGEVAEVLGRCALYDYRDVTKFDVAAWYAVIGHHDLGDAIEAVVRHYADSTDRIMPAHINRLVKQIREDRRRLEQKPEVLALPSRFEDDINRQVQLKQGAATAREVLGPLLEHLASRSQPQQSAMEQLRELTAAPASADPDTEVPS